eukprot:11167297-Lingulodinium_polyedra.AAC.1
MDVDAQPGAQPAEGRAWGLGEGPRAPKAAQACPTRSAAGGGSGHPPVGAVPAQSGGPASP